MVGEGSEAGLIVSDRRAGLVVPAADVEATRAALERLVAGDLPAPVSRDVTEYSYTTVATRLSELIDDVA